MPRGDNLTAEARSKGGHNTHRLHGLTTCSKCGSVITSEGYADLKRKGAEVQHQVYSREQFSKWGRSGGRGRKKGSDRESTDASITDEARISLASGAEKESASRG